MKFELLKMLEADFKKNFTKTIASRYWHRRTNKMIKYQYFKSKLN